MQAIITFWSEHGHWLIVIIGGPIFLWIANHMDKEGEAFVLSELELLRAELKNDPVLGQLDATNAVMDILESYIPECMHEFDETIKAEVKNGQFSSLDWVALGKKLWEKGRTEICDGAVNYWRESGQKDEQALAAMIAKKFFHKQAALQQGLIVPHD